MHVCLAGAASRVTTSAASRCACWTPSSAAHRRRGCSRRCARSAAWPTRSTRSPRCTPARARSACTSARAPTTCAPRWRSSPAELERAAEDPATDAELARAKENAKGRNVLSLESTGARMNRLGSSVLADLPLLTDDEVLERIDAVTLDDVRALALELFAPGTCRRRASARRGRFPRERSSPSLRLAARHDPRRRRRRGGPHGRDRLRGGRGRRRHGAGRPGRSGAGRGAGRHPRRRRRGRGLHPARPARPTRWPAWRPACTPSSAPPAWSSSRCGRPLARRQRLLRPELRDRRGADDALRRRGQPAHGQGGDHRAAPRRQARRAVGHRRAHRRDDGRPTCRSTRSGCPAWSPIRRSSSAASARR